MKVEQIQWPLSELPPGSIQQVEYEEGGVKKRVFSFPDENGTQVYCVQVDNQYWSFDPTFLPVVSIREWTF